MELENLIDKETIQSYVSSGNSYRDISTKLRCVFPNVNGLSVRSVRRYCEKFNIRKISNDQLDHEVSTSVQEVGPTYGTKTMKGYLESKGVTAGRNRVMQSLKRVKPDDYERRRADKVRCKNPIPYFSPYHGHKLHVDQNEKLVYFGVTHVLFSDGYSRKIVCSVTMPIKNPIVIYRAYRKLLLEQGMWNMLRSDHGKEFCLIQFVQERLKDHRFYTDCPSFVQSRSTENLRAERKWPEVNQRFNYVIKSALIDMQRRGVINLLDECVKFCVSFIACTLSEVGMTRMIAAWNNHPIEGYQSRVPERLARENNHASRLAEHVVPTVEDAVRQYEAAGGRLTRLSYFGIDPLRSSQNKIDEREENFRIHNSSFQEIFKNLVNGNPLPLESATISFIDITQRLM